MGHPVNIQVKTGIMTCDFFSSGSPVDQDDQQTSTATTSNSTEDDFNIAAEMFEDSVDEIDEDECPSDPIATSSEGGSNDSLDQLDRLSAAFGSARLVEDDRLSRFNEKIDKRQGPSSNRSSTEADVDKKDDAVLMLPKDCKNSTQNNVDKPVGAWKQQPVGAVDEKESSLVSEDSEQKPGGQQEDQSCSGEKELTRFHHDTTPHLDLHADNNSAVPLSTTDNRDNSTPESLVEEEKPPVRKPESLSQQLESQSQQERETVEAVMITPRDRNESIRAESNESLDSGNDSGAGGGAVSIVTGRHHHAVKTSIAVTKPKASNGNNVTLPDEEFDGEEERSIELRDLQNALHMVRHQTSTTSSNSSSGSPMEIRSTKVQRHHQHQQEQQQEHQLSTAETVTHNKSNKKERGKHNNKKEKSKSKKKSKSKTKVSLFSTRQKQCGGGYSCLYSIAY